MIDISDFNPKNIKVDKRYSNLPQWICNTR